VRGVRVVGLASNAAEIEISFVGSSEQLGLGLAQQDLALGMGTDGHYLLSSIAASPPAGPPAPVPAPGDTGAVPPPPPR
jgi:hypothetical protein